MTLLSPLKALMSRFQARRSLSINALAAPYQLRKAYRHQPNRPGLEPTRFGDWEYNGRCTDFI